MASIDDMIKANQLGEDLTKSGSRELPRQLPLLGGLFLHTDREVLAKLCAFGNYESVANHYPEVLRAMDDGRKAIEQLGGRAGHLIFINGCVQVLPTRQYANVVGVVNFSRDLMAQGAEIEGRLEDEALPAPELRLQHAAGSETGLSVGPAIDIAETLEQLFIQKLAAAPQGLLKTVQVYALEMLALGRESLEARGTGHVGELIRKHVTPWAMASAVNCELALYYLAAVDPEKNGGSGCSPDLTWILGDAFLPGRLR